MSLLRRLDPDSAVRLSVAAVVSVICVVWVFARSPQAAVALCVVALGAALVLGLNARGLLHPLWPFAILAVLMPLNGLRPVPGASYGDIALILAGVALLPFMRRARPPGQLMVALLGCLVITGGGLLGMAVEQDWGGATELAKFMLGAPMVIIIVILLNPTPAQAVFLLKFYALGGALSALATITETVDPNFQRAHGWGAHIGHLGLACLVGALVMLGWFLETRRLPIKLLAAFGVLVNVFGITQTGTRSIMIGFIAALLFVAVCARGNGMIVLGGAMSLMVAAYFTIVPYLPNAEGIRRIVGQGELAGLATVSANEHSNALDAAFLLIDDHPLFGAGFSQGLVAHNLVLQVLSVGGVVALTGLVLIWGTFFLMAFQRVMLGMSPTTAMKTCTLAAVLGYFVFAMFQPLIWDRHLWFVIALTFIVQTPQNPQQPTSEGALDERDEPARV